MREFKHFERVLKEIQEDIALKNGEIIIVEVDRECDSMLRGAYRLTADSTVEQVAWETVSSVDEADSAKISLSEGGEAVVAFHLTRPSNRDHRPNGIRLHHEELGVPCVVFVNSGKEALTLDGEWLEPGKYVTVRERDMDDPDVQAFFRREFLQRPDVQAEIREVQQKQITKK